MYEFRRTQLSMLAAAVALVAQAACGGGDKSASTPAPPATVASAASVMPVAGAPPAGATVAMVAEGDSVFHGLKGGGICFSCHMPDANGGPLAPSLVDTAWVTIDGSYVAIQKRVTDGMPNPTPPYLAPMLPMGGAQLTPDQVKSVAAYVYAISHK
jgi:mono/diheme cytochrome c family protein